jgi:hypothetical protein
MKLIENYVSNHINGFENISILANPFCYQLTALLRAVHGIDLGVQVNSILKEFDSQVALIQAPRQTA